MTYTERINQDWNSIPGWCSESKREYLRHAALSCKEDAIEIGVWGGRSAFAIAGCLPRWRTLWTIDPFSSKAGMLDHEDDAPIFTTYWSQQRHYDDARTQWLTRLVEYGLTHKVRMIEVPDKDAANAFKDEAYGLLHVDGNHGPVEQKATTLRWLRKLKPGGILVMDDTNMETVKPAVEAAAELCDEIHRNEVETINWMVWRKR